MKHDKTKSFINGDLMRFMGYYIQCDVMEIDLRDI